MRSSFVYIQLHMHIKGNFCSRLYRLEATGRGEKRRRKRRRPGGRGGEKRFFEFLTLAD